MNCQDDVHVHAELCADRLLLALGAPAPAAALGRRVNGFDWIVSSSRSRASARNDQATSYASTCPRASMPATGVGVKEEDKPEHIGDDRERHSLPFPARRRACDARVGGRRHRRVTTFEF